MLHSEKEGEGGGGYPAGSSFVVFVHNTVARMVRLTENVINSKM